MLRLAFGAEPPAEGADVGMRAMFQKAAGADGQISVDVLPTLFSRTQVPFWDTYLPPGRAERRFEGPLGPFCRTRNRRRQFASCTLNGQILQRADAISQPNDGEGLIGWVFGSLTMFVSWRLIFG